MGFQLPITINKAIEAIQANEYVLPAIQREFVWSAEQIEKLFDSLMRGYPIGTFLFWRVKPEKFHEFQFYRFMDRYHQRDHTHNEPIAVASSNPVTAVLDGQQRLTALNIGLKGTYADKLPHLHWRKDDAFPSRQLYLNLMAPAKKEDVEFGYEFRMLRPAAAERHDDTKFWFRVGDILRLASLRDVFRYCADNGLAAPGQTFPSDTLMKLWEVIKNDQLIHSFVEEEQDLDKVLNIFIRVNSAGTQLSYSDMLLSIATAQWSTLDARKEILELVDTLNGADSRFNLDKDFILKAALVLSDIPTIEFRVDNFKKANMRKIESQWGDISRALQQTVQLIGSWGYSAQTLTSAYAMIPLAYYFRKKAPPHAFILGAACQPDREAMLRFLRAALLRQTFGGQPDSVLRTIRGAMQGSLETFPLDGISAALHGGMKSLAFDQSELEGLLTYRFGQGYTFSVLAMLYPWLKYDQQFHIDHLHPRGMFTVKELTARRIPQNRWPEWLDHGNDLANLQLLQGIPNQEKSDKELAAWHAAVHPTPRDDHAYRDLHLIPSESLDFQDFPEFVKAREKLILSRLAGLFGVQLSNGRANSI